MKKRFLLFLVTIFIFSVSCVLFTSCNKEPADPIVVTYTDRWNSPVWEKAYSNLQKDYDYASDYNTFRSACKNLSGDEVSLSGEKKDGVRISSIEKETTDILNIYTLNLNNGYTYSFAVLGYTPEDTTMSFYEVYKLYHTGVTMSENTFISRFARADIYATVTLELNGGTYDSVTTMTDLCGFTLNLGTPERGDDIFYGWFYDKELTKKESDTQISVDTDTVLYASWEAYDYESVDYSLWDKIKNSLVENIASFYSEDMKTQLKEFEEDVESRRGSLTQNEVDDYVNQYNYMLNHADFIDADTVRIYVSVGDSITKNEYIGAAIAVVDESGGTYGSVYDFSGQIKIRGNSTADADKVGYNIKFSSKTSVLGMASSKKWCLLANAFDKTLARNAVMFELSEILGLSYTCNYRVAELFINGKNIGCYMIVESIDVGKDKVDIDTDNGDVLFELEADGSRFDEDMFYFFSGTYGVSFGIAEPSPISVKQASSAIDLISKAELAMKEKNFDKIKKYIDVDSFVATYIVQEYLKNVDSWLSSARFYIKDGILYSGPMWDFDLSMGNVNHNTYTSYCNYGTSDKSYSGTYATNFTWYRELMGCQEFVDLVAAKYKECQSAITGLYAGADNFIDTFVSENKGVIDRNYQSIPYGGAGWLVYEAMGNYEMVPKSTYDANVQFLKEWLGNRNTWMKEYLKIS